MLHTYQQNNTIYFFIGNAGIEQYTYFKICVPLYDACAYIQSGDAIFDSAHTTIANDYSNSHDFASELFETMNVILRSKFPHIKHVEITDESCYGCNRPHHADNIELITYSTALFAKNWYEARLNAYIKESHKKYNYYNSAPYQTVDEYKEQVKQYASKENKDLWPFDDFFKIPCSWYVGDEDNCFIKDHEFIKQMYESTLTFPDFFAQLNARVERKYRGRFYRSWLHIFMEKNITHHKTWLYDVMPDKTNFNAQLIVASMPSKPLNSFKLETHTEHYHFIVDVLEYENGIHLLVGHENRPCLRVFIERTNGIESHIATLDKIEAIKDCSYDNVNDDYLEKYSFGLELLQFVNFILKRQFPYVKKVRLEDQSNIVCNRSEAAEDTLDLKTYNIALHKKTWYEMKLGAYMELPRDMDIYKSGIELYGNMKLESFSDFFREVVLNMKGNTFAKDFFRINRNKIQTMYENAKSYPEFFKLLGTLVSRKDKCKLFKTWLQMFIREKIRFHGTWMYDLDKISAGGTRRRQRRRAPNTRKAAK